MDYLGKLNLSYSHVLKLLTLSFVYSPSDVNPADHLLDVISNNDEKVQSTVNKNIKIQLPIDLSRGEEKGAYNERSNRSWLSQYFILCHRNFKQYQRRMDIFITNIIATSVLSIFIGMGVWHQIGTSQASIAT